MVIFFPVIPAAILFDKIEQDVKKHCLIRANQFTMNSSGKRKYK